MKREYLTASNLLSLTRIFLVAPFLLVMFSGIPSARWWAAAIMAVGALTDRLDGLLARRLGQETEVGRILDPLADKVAVAAVGLALLVLELIPLWFIAAMLGRDVLILAGGLFVRNRTGRVPPSNTAGKWTVGIIALTLAAALMEAPSWVLDALLVASTIALAMSLAGYLKTFIDSMRAGPGGDADGRN